MSLQQLALLSAACLGLLFGSTNQAQAENIKVVIGKHPPKAKQAAAETEKIVKNWCPVLSAWLGKKLDKPLEVRVEFIDDPKGGIAVAVGNTITVNLATCLQGSHIDEGIMIHELTHIIQLPYPDSVPGWLVEGMADYTRWVRYEPHNWDSCPLGKGESYKDGYGRAADFLGWVERHHDRKLMQQIHAAACAGKYTDDIFRKLTKETLDQLWEEYVEAKKATDAVRTFHLVNVRNGHVLTVHGKEGKEEVTLVALSRKEDKGQLWRIEKVKDDYVLVNVATKLALEVPEKSSEMNARLIIGTRLDAEKQDAKNQLWQVVRSGEHFWLRSKLSGQYASASDAQVIQSPKHTKGAKDDTKGEEDDQLWSIQVAD
jgi:hypothetical protein